MIFLGDLTDVGMGPVKRVGLCHFMPLDAEHGFKDDSGNCMTKDQIESSYSGIMVDSIPEPQPPEGKEPVATFVNIVTKEVTYSYVDIPKTAERELKESKELMAAMLLALVDGGLM